MFLTIIFKSFSNLREIIRFINSISVCLKSNQIIKLDVIDLIALEYIKFVDIELYCNIGSNGFYFVSDDNQYVSDYEYLFSETYNKLTKEKYDSLFKGKDIYISLLSNVFPYVKSYKDNNNFRNDYFIPMRDERNAVLLDKRCFNGRYFGVYYSFKT